MKALYIGTALIDSIIRNVNPQPVSRTGYIAQSGYLAPGGEAVNGATALSRLGWEVSLLAFLGNDPGGDLLENTLREYHVDTSRIIRTSEASTPVSTLIVDAEGNRKSITNQAHRYNFHPEKYTDCFAGYDCIALTSLFRTPFNDPSIIYRVLRCAGDLGIRTFADTKLPNFKQLTLEDLRDSLPLIDTITPNEDEAFFFTGKQNPEEAADVFLQYGVKNAVIKLGSKGCFLKNADGCHRLSAYDIAAIDATGAGDNFLAGLIATGDPAFANACGAICAMHPGAVGAIENEAQVREFMRTCPGK